jgi:hypothetical protein
MAARHMSISEDKMAEPIRVGDRVKIYLDSRFWKSEGWFEGRVVRIDPYSKHRQFYWVELDVDVEALQGGRSNLVSVFNPKNILTIK